VKHWVVFGTRDAIEEVLAAWGWKINTSFVERLNLDLRQRVAAIGRRVNTLCQGQDSMRHQLVLFHAYHNFLPAACELAGASGGACIDQRHGLRQAVAAAHASDGGRTY
jgi:hypothetical protein